MEYDPELESVADKFVTPFYLEMLHGNVLRREVSARSDFVREFHLAASQLDEETAARFLDFPEWRGRMAVSWMVGVRGWESLVPKMGDHMIQSELVYAGQGFAVGLALLGSDGAVHQLQKYLDHWLPEVDCFYDQHWAMAAVSSIDERKGTFSADRQNENWRTWASHGGRSATLAPVAGIVALLLGHDDEARRSGGE